jgi:hypothetical protein
MRFMQKVISTREEAAYPQASEDAKTDWMPCEIDVIAVVRFGQRRVEFPEARMAADLTVSEARQATLRVAHYA